MTSSNLARYPSLARRTVLVTGGASGIGAAIVEAFCQQGGCWASSAAEARHRSS